MTLQASAERTEQTVKLWDGQLTMQVVVAGHGAPLLYLHPMTGLLWDRSLTTLSGRFTVYAPRFPGSTPGDPEAARTIRSLPDLVLVYEELVRRLGLQRPAVVGASFGGMLAAELAATFPALPGPLVLAAPLGLWSPQAPVANWLTTAPDQWPALLFRDTAGEAVRTLFQPPADPEAASKAAALRVWTLGATSQYLWPLPDRGLRSRLHRIDTPTLVLWGRQDALAPAAYAEEFRAGVWGARVAYIDECGHLPLLERPEQSLAAINGFLGAVSA